MTTEKVSGMHPAAVEAFNATAEGLIAVLERASPPTATTGGTGDRYATPFDADAIAPLSARTWEQTFEGDRTTCYFQTQTMGDVRLGEHAHTQLNALCARVAAHPMYKDGASVEFIYDTAIGWIVQRVDRAAEAPDFCAYLEKAFAASARKSELWIPIPIVSIPHPFRIGRTTFRRITKDMVDAYLARLGVAADETRGAVGFLRHRIQGSTAACVEVFGEPIHASQRAAFEVDSAVAMVRLACPAIFTARKWAPLDPSEIDRAVGRFELTVDDRTIVSERASSPPGMLMHWRLDKSDIASHLGGLWKFCDSLILAERNEFQVLLLDATVHFSKSILRPEPADRLMYVTTALESLLTTGENIAQNLRERMAIVSKPSDRIAVLKLVDAVYKMRSEFVHRALPVTDVGLLQEFFTAAWAMFFFLLGNHDRWPSKRALLNTLDAHKFSGPMFTISPPPRDG